MNVFDLSARIALDSKEYTSGLESASATSESFGGKLKSALGTAGQVAIGVVTAVASAVVALSAKMAEGIQQTAEYGDNIDKMSQKMGLSAQTYQEWDFIMQHAGTSIESMKASMKTLANSAESGNEAFARLGITQEQIANMSQEELFGATIEALQGVEDTTERTYLAGQLLGRGATELGALLNMSAEDTEAMRQQVHDLGGVMSDEAVKASAQYADSLQNLKTAISGLSRGAFAEFLPATVSIMDGLTAIFSGDSGSGLDLIKQGINGFTEQMTAMLPKVMDIGSEIVLSLIEAIVTNLPTLVSTATSTVMTFIQGLISMLPQIIESGIQVILALVRGIADALPTLIPAIVEAVLLIVETFLENIDLIIDVALQLILGFVDGLIQAIPVIIDHLPEIINALIDGLLGAIPQIIEAGITLLTSLIQAIPEIIAGIVEHLPEIIEGVIDGILDNLPAIIEAGIELFIALIKATPEIIAGIVEHLPEIIVGIVEGLASLAWELVQAGVDLMVSLGEGIASWASGVWESVKEVVQGAIDSIGEFFSGMWEAGLNLIKGLWEGIKSAGSWLWEQITGFANDVVGWFKGAFGIKSPSRVMAGIGDMLGQGLALGMDDSLSDVLDSASNIHDSVNDALADMGGVVDVESSMPTFDNLQMAQTQGEIAITSRLDSMESNLYRAIVRALSDGVNIRWNDRELARLIKDHA